MCGTQDILEYKKRTAIYTGGISLCHVQGVLIDGVEEHSMCASIDQAEANLFAGLEGELRRGVDLLALLGSSGCRTIPFADSIHQCRVRTGGRWRPKVPSFAQHMRHNITRRTTLYVIQHPHQINCSCGNTSCTSFYVTQLVIPIR